MRSSFWVGFGMSALFGSVGLISTDALADYTRGFSSTACVKVDGGTLAITTDGLVNNHPTEQLMAACPIVSDSYLGAGGGPGNWSAITASSAHLFGYSNGLYQLAAFACRTYATGSGGLCDSGAYAFSSGVNDLSFDPSSTWASGSPNDGYFMLVGVGPGSKVFSYNFQH